MSKFLPQYLARAWRGAVVLLVLASLIVSAAALARGGQAADDCPPGSKDPDCRSAGHPP